MRPLFKTKSRRSLLESWKSRFRYHGTQGANKLADYIAWLAGGSPKKKRAQLGLLRLDSLFCRNGFNTDRSIVKIYFPDVRIARGKPPPATVWSSLVAKHLIFNGEYCPDSQTNSANETKLRQAPSIPVLPTSERFEIDSTFRTPDLAAALSFVRKTNWVRLLGDPLNISQW